MGKGFIFNPDKCVACNACSAACTLENRWTIQARSIFTYNSTALPNLPVINISMACNHCEVPVCLEGCPTNSYSRDPFSGAIIIDGKKCIGCKYCQWNCPYDAPKFDTENRIIVKCNLCYQELKEGYLPYCTTACPTGALSFGELTQPEIRNAYSWYPDKNLNPGFIFSGRKNTELLRVIPENILEPEGSASTGNEKNINKEWSLIAFSFLATISVASIILSLFNDHFPGRNINILIIILAGLLSLFHLGKKFRAWRALANLRRSMLSKEIAIFILYSGVSIIAVTIRLPILILVASVVGLILLIVIDGVYIFADRRKQVILNSGQTFITALLIVSFFSGAVLSFIFIATIKLVSSVYRMSVIKPVGLNFGLRFFRIALLLLTGAVLISKISYSDPVIFFLFLIGEFFDRLIFYFDFSPLSINILIDNQIKK